MSARSTEMRKQLDILSKHLGILLAENTKMRKQSDILSKQYVFLLTKSTRSIFQMQQAVMAIAKI